jgi:DNA modification methylase
MSERREADHRSNLTGAPPTPAWATGTGTANMAPGTSIFDPVLCELVYRWFCPPGGLVLDPFAGGSVRGIVASKLGRQYIGVDLRAEQIAANRDQAAGICDDPQPAWIVGDALNVAALAEGVAADLVFSCPPYADLERYSDDPLDLSTLDYPAFRDKYRAIVAASVGLLKPDRFACFVVGDVRDRKGFYRRFVSDTEQAFEDAGARLYNEAILVTATGSLPVRVGRQFEAGRKLGKTHQNVLVFCKGDPKRATAAIGPVEFGALEEDAAGSVDEGADAA